MGKTEKERPWIEIEALVWSSDGRLMIRARGSGELVDARRFLYALTDGKDLGPINLIGCGGPDPSPNPTNICTTVNVVAIRPAPNGVEVRTDRGKKRLDEMMRLDDAKGGGSDEEARKG